MDKAEVIDIFKRYFLVWMCQDIENCIKGKANFAVAALLMSYSENVGALMEGHLGLSRTSAQDFRKFLEHLDFNGNADYYKNFRINYQEPPSSAIKTVDIYTAFRCGLIHEYAPKVSCIIENHSDDINHFEKTDPGIGWHTPGSTNGYSGQSGYMPPTSPKALTLRFHTNAYFRDFKNALNKIYQNISRDAALLKNIQKSLERVLNRKLII
jgi:hypothetical protein